MKVLLLSRKDMQAVISMNEAIAADKDALSVYSKGEAIIPLRTNIDIAPAEGQSLYMPGYAGKDLGSGIKIVSVYPKNVEKGKTSVPATMVLLDENSGEVKCLLDGTYLTQLRTGALSGAATDLLARKDAKKFLLIGTGGQALTQVEAVLAVRAIEDFYVVDLNAERAEAFAAQIAEKYPHLHISVLNSPAAVESEVDIITTVTTASKPVFSGKNLKKGVHINSVGSYTPSMQETPISVLEQADKIFLDTIDGVVNESGDVIEALRSGAVSLEKVSHELGQLINNEIPGRESDEEITWFKTTGSAVLDIVMAERIYQCAVSKNMGQLVEF